MVRNQYYKEINEEILFIKEDKTFSYCKDTIGHLVTVESKLANTESNDLMIKQIERAGLKDNMYFICPDLSEVLCFLHEVGHFINAITTGIDNTGYKEFKTKTYYNINQAIKEYKQIPAEAYADKFAVEFVNKNIIDIWNIMQPELSKEEIREFLEL
jgi:hypothetical protein